MTVSTRLASPNKQLEIPQLSLTKVRIVMTAGPLVGFLSTVNTVRGPGKAAINPILTRITMTRTRLNPRKEPQLVVERAREAARVLITQPIKPLGRILGPGECQTAPRPRSTHRWT